MSLKNLIEILFRYLNFFLGKKFDIIVSKAKKMISIIQFKILNFDPKKIKENF